MSQTHNRQAQVMVDSHPDCRACPALRTQLNNQIVANGLLRIEVQDLRTQVRRLGGTPTISRTTAEAHTRLEGQL